MRSIQTLTSRLIRALSTPALRSTQIELEDGISAVLRGRANTGIPQAGENSFPRAYSAEAKSLETIHRLFDINDKSDPRAFVDAVSSNRYVKSRLLSLLEGAPEGDGTRTEPSVDDTDAMLTEMFRYHNASMLKQLSEGHMVKATVVKVDGRKAILDLRNGRFATIGVHELGEDSILERGDGRHVEGRGAGGAEDGVVAGDTVQVFLESIETPEGDVLVRGQESAVARRTKAVWQELLERLKDGRPVKGRLLNSLAGGYSVGVAGIVCFLPNRNASKVTVGRIGELNDYRVIQMNASRSNVVLSDCRLNRRERAGGRGKKGGGRGRGGELLRY